METMNSLAAVLAGVGVGSPYALIERFGIQTAFTVGLLWWFNSKFWPAHLKQIEQSHSIMQEQLDAAHELVKRNEIRQDIATAEFIKTTSMERAEFLKALQLERDLFTRALNEFHRRIVDDCWAPGMADRRANPNKKEG